MNNSVVILLVEDDAVLRSTLKTALMQSGYSVLAVGTKKDALALISQKPALALLDLNLPDGDGFSLCQSIKQLGNIPVVFLTVRDSEADIVKGLDMGGDDYVIKPFRLPVLLSRIRAVLRRSDSLDQNSDCLLCGNIKMIPSRTEVYVDEKIVILTAGEFHLLEILLRHKNQTLTRTCLLERIWDAEGNFVGNNTLTVTMKRLREKVEENPQSPRLLKTVRGIGYKAVDENEN